MPENTALGAARLLSIVTWLSTQPGGVSTVGEIADHFHRSVSQVERDLMGLTYFRDSLPGESFELMWEPAPAGSRGKSRAEVSVAVRQAHGMTLPQVFQPEQAARMIVAIKALLPTIPDDLRAHVPGALIALEQMVHPGRALRSAVIDCDNIEDLPTLPSLRQAIDTGKGIECSYTNAQGVTSTRRLVPQQLRRDSRGWLLHAIDADTGRKRTFNVARMDAITHTSITSQESTDMTTEAATTVRLLIDAPAQWLLDEYADAEDPQDSGWPRWIRLRVWNEDWVRATIISISPWLRSIDAPKILFERVTDHAVTSLNVWNQVLDRLGESDSPSKGA